MLESLELLLMGVAVVIDMVLLLIVCERANRAKTADWLRLLTIGVCLVHGCNFFHILIRDTQGAIWLQLDRLCFSFLAIGFLVLPSAMLHAATRLTATGIDPRPSFDWRYVSLYLPLSLIPTVLGMIWRSESRDFFQAVRPIVGAYAVWLIVANTCSMFLFFRLRRHFQMPGASRFFTQLAGVLAMLTGFSTAYILTFENVTTELSLRLITVLLPLVPAILFVWYILRQRMLPLVIERTFVYAGIIAVVVLIHRLAVAPLTTEASRRANLDFVLVEWIVIFGLVVLVRPLRDRARGALRYLLSYDALQIQEITRRLSVELSQQSETSLDELVKWFVAAMQDGLGVESARVKLNEPFEQLIADSPKGYLRIEDLNPGAIPADLQSSKTAYVFRLSFRTVQGMVMLGARRRGDRLAEEQLTAVAMLCDQFAATFYNRQLELERLSRERKTMQQEKLSILGLTAGSIAHEIRNPLSSMRTIATLMKEDLPNDGERSREVNMLIAEIDRLTQTTHRLLDFARPGDNSVRQVAPDVVIARLLHILEQYANQNRVRLSSKLDASKVYVEASDASIGEIVFNLVRNAIEAAREVAEGEVFVSSRICDYKLVIRIEDNGNGIEPGVRQKLFQPFVTGKIDGTGLGLFTVAERVRELGGELICSNEKEVGTTFEVRLSPTEPPSRVRS